MVQGSALKKPSAPTAATKTSSAGGKRKPQQAKKGARVIKPNGSKKSSGRAAADKMRKKLNAGLTTKTEKVLGERAGHLELIGKGRDRSQNATKGKGGSDKKTGGGSKKFG